jgi:predicted lipoprotein with Yx(FWY)xxD motif
MHNITKLGVGAIAATLLAACGSDSKATTTPTTKVAVTTSVAAKPTTTVKSATAPTTTVKSATATTTVATKTGATAGALALATTSKGKVLVDSEGRTLYLYTKDTQNKPSTCEAACATNWPPEIASGTPVAGTGLDAGKLSVMKRTDGTEQLAYNGWPLYRYTKDTKAGDDIGEGVGGIWFVVDATGNAIKS